MSRNEITLVSVLLLLCLTLFFFRLGARPLWDPDEGKHASTSKDMVLSGDWITPTFNGEKFYDKPILYNWLAALSFLVFGFTEFAARLPAALLGLGCVMVTYLLGRRMFSPMVGFLGGVILASSPEYIVLSRAVVHDISLAFFVTLSLYFFYQGFTSDRRRKTYFLLFYASSGFAVLAKGPLGAVLPALVIGLFLALKGNLRFVKRMHIGSGALVFLAVAAPWYVLISMKNSDYAGYFFIQKNIMSFLPSGTARHSEPFYYYLPVLLGGFSPWSFFLPLALIRSFQGRLREMDERNLFLVLWFAAIFFFFSAANSKLPTYILPAFPATALLVGVLCNDLLSAPTPVLRKGFLYSYLPIVVILSLALVYSLINPPTSLESRYGIDLIRVHFIGFTIAGIAALSFFMLVRRHYQFFFLANVGLVAAGVVLFIVLLVPLINPYRSLKELAPQLDLMATPGQEVVFYREIGDSVLFYTNRKARVMDLPRQVIHHLTSNKDAFCVIRKKYVREVANLPEISRVIAQSGDLLIISAKTAD